MRKLRQMSVTRKFKGGDRNPHPALDELTAHLTDLGVPEGDVLSVDVDYHCRETEVFDFWSVTVTATYWTMH